MKPTPSGWIPLPRSLTGEDLWEIPPAWLKVWLWINLTAAWRDTETTSAGTVRATYTQDALPGVSADQYRAAIAWLSNNGHIRTTRERYGTLIQLAQPEPHQPPSTIDSEFTGWFQTYPNQQQQRAASLAYRKARTTASAADLQAGRDRLLDAIRMGHYPANRVPYAHRWLTARRWTDTFGPPKLQTTKPATPEDTRDKTIRYWAEKLWAARASAAEYDRALSVMRSATTTTTDQSLTIDITDLIQLWKDTGRQ